MRDRPEGAYLARDQEHRLGITDAGDGGRRLLLVIVVAIVLTVLVAVFFVGVQGPASESPAAADEPAWGAATDETTRVQAPRWWSPEP